MNLHVDDRRTAFFNVFPCDGQLSVLRLRTGAISAWHRHQRQDDYFFCVHGVVRVGTDDAVEPWATLDAHAPEVLCVPRGVWHGYHCLSADAILLVWSTQKYDPTDEERRPATEAEWARLPH